MKKIEIIIDGTAYPCLMTMGAVIDFKELTGHEVHEMTNGPADLLALLYSCIKSACRREKRDFPYTLTDFADSLTLDEVTAMTAAIMDNAAKDADADGKKKADSPGQ